MKGGSLLGPSRFSRGRRPDRQPYCTMAQKFRDLGRRLNSEGRTGRSKFAADAIAQLPTPATLDDLLRTVGGVMSSQRTSAHDVALGRLAPQRCPLWTAV